MALPDFDTLEEVKGSLPDFESLKPVEEEKDVSEPLLASVPDATAAGVVAQHQAMRRQEYAKFGEIQKARESAGIPTREEGPFATIMGAAEETGAGLANIVLPRRKVFRMRFGPGEAPPLEMATEPRVLPGESVLPPKPVSQMSDAEKLAYGFTTPGQILTLPFAGSKVAAISRPIQALYAGAMAEQLPGQIKEAVQTGDREKVTQAGESLLMLAAMLRAGTRAKGRDYATEERRIRQGAEPEYRGDDTLRPPEEGRAGGGVPTAKGLEEKAQVLLSPEERSYLESERKAIDSPVEVVDQLHDEVGAPFAGTARIATVRPDGTIEIVSNRFKQWLNSVPAASRPIAVRALLSEEMNHRAVNQIIGDEGAAQFWRGLTGAEKALHFRRYTGHWTPESLLRERGATFTDAQLGYEAMNSFQMRLARMSLREAAEAAFREKWTVRTLDSVANAIFKARQLLGKEGGPAGTQGALLRKVMENLQTARVIASGGQSPGAMLKEYEEAAGKKFDPKDYGDDDIRFTVFKMGIPGVRDAVQADSVKGGINEFSTNPNELKANGFDVPSTQEILAKLPAGQYSLGEVKRVLAGEPVLYNLDEAAAELRRQPGREFAPAIRDAAGKVTEGTSHDDLRRQGITGTPGFTDADGNFLTMLDAARRKMEQGPGAFRKTPEELREEREFALLRETWLPTQKPWRQQLLDEEVRKGEGGVNIETNFYDAGEAATRRAKRYYELAHKLYGGREAPGAFHKFRKGKPEEQPELFLPGLTSRRELTRPETAPAGVGAAEHIAAAYKPVTPQAMQETITAHLTQMDRPSFAALSGHAKATYGTALQSGQLREAWEDAVWNYLLRAPGERIQKLADKLKIGRYVGKGATRRLAAKREVAAPPPEEAFRLETEVAPEAKPQVAEEVQSQIKAQQYRNKVVSLIAQKLIKESYREAPPLSRKTITPDDLGYSGAETRQPVYNEIGSELEGSPNVLGRVLTSDAGTDRTGAGALPVSATKRVTAIMDRKTGKVQLVSTYFDPRRGAVLLDPAAPAPTHVKLETLLPRYRVIASLLLDEPVQNFRKGFDSLSDFNEQLGAEARSRSQMSEYGFPSEGPVSEAPIEGTEGLEGEGGLVTGPQAGVARAEMGIARGAMEARVPITEPEAVTLFDHLIAEVDKVESSADVKDAVAGITYDFNEGKLSEDSRVAAIAYAKIYRTLQRRFPNLTKEEVLDKLYEEIAAKAKAAETVDAFASSIVQSYARRRAPDVLGIGEPTPAETGRELTTRLPGTYLSIVGRKGGRPPGEVLRKGEGPTPELPKPSPEEVLTPEERAFMESQVAPRPPGYELAKAPEGLQVWVKRRGPAAFNKLKASAEDEYVRTRNMLSAHFDRRATERDIVRWRDAADTSANNYARQSGNSIRVLSQNPVVRRAATFVISAGGDRSKLAGFVAQAENAMRKAQALLKSASPTDNWIGRRWLKSAEEIRGLAEYADQHWNDADLQGTASKASAEMKGEFDFEVANGINLREEPNYIPGRYDAEFFNDNAVMFGARRILGRNYRQPKTFSDYAEAIEAGPYIPQDLDVANLAEHRVRQGRKEVNKRLWLERLKNVQDPVTGSPILREAVERTVPGKKPGTTAKVDVSPGPEYDAFRAGASGKLYYVRAGYKDLLEVLTMQSSFAKSPIGKAALHATGFLKHGIILIFDTFHPSRLGQYALSLLGKEAGFKGGYSALEYRDVDLAAAVRQGHITQEAADWASKPVEVTMPNGTKRSMSRRQILEAGQAEGLNTGRLTDAIYVDTVRSIPVIGTMNKWIFDKFTRGLMAETFVREFERLNKSHPEVPARDLLKDVVRDTNIYYGSLGRQGWIRNPTFRDITQLAFLAPQWVEGLIQKEVRFGARLAMAPYRLARGQIAMGTIGRGMGRGLLSYLVLSQVLNLITRRQPTWQNKERGHKLDAWIPTGEDSGFWLSPMSVFAELTHDFIRLSESKPTTYDAIRQIGSNKLGPWGRLGMILATRETAAGQRITSTAGIAKEAGKQLFPAPISLATFARAGAHAVAPSLVSPPRPGQVQRQMLAGAGIKVQPGDTALKQVQDMADRFVRENDLKKETGFEMVPTDEASYSKLRLALRNDDPKNALAILKELRKTRTDDEILKGMKLWSSRPLTGSEQNEQLWLNSLSDEEIALYAKALESKQEVWNKFLDFYMAH